MSTKEITSSDDIIDSRDVIARIQELEDNLEDNFLDVDEKAELDALKALADEGESATREWVHGATLISESYFTEYAEELANDCCELPKDLKWPFTCIDWQQAADELKHDYTTVTFCGCDYYVLSC